MTKPHTLSELKKQEKKARQEMIISAAERVFAAKAFNKVSMRDIAKEAEISSTLIYRYFPDQQNLFVEAFIKNGKILMEFLHKTILENKKTDIEKITEIFIEFYTQNDLFFKMTINFMLGGTLDEDLLIKIKDMERKIFSEFDVLFQDNVNTKMERRFSHAFFSALNGVVISFMNYPSKSHKEVVCHMKSVAGIIASMFNHGMKQLKSESDSK